MLMHRQANHYQEVEVNTASRTELIVLLYDAAIANLQKAQEHLRGQEISSRVRCLNKATSILTELQTALDFQAGGEIATSLDRLYRYMKERIFQANLKQDRAPLEEVGRLLENLRSAWIEVAKSQTRKPQPSERSRLDLVPNPMFKSPVPERVAPVSLNLRA